MNIASLLAPSSVVRNAQLHASAGHLQTPKRVGGVKVQGYRAGIDVVLPESGHQSKDRSVIPAAEEPPSGAGWVDRFPDGLSYLCKEIERSATADNRDNAHMHGSIGRCIHNERSSIP
ncbi:hypothetical protein H9L39_19303 [Fusarium oxysporum f. sp. albedinis]|nr:hypothetical protein H9L39_19303 [Fusarium oxysporum f. sp. albedinis]